MTANRRTKDKAIKKVQIAIDKIIDLIDLQVSGAVSECAGNLLDRLRELESKINN